MSDLPTEDPRILSPDMLRTLHYLPNGQGKEPWLLQIPHIRAAIDAGYIGVSKPEHHVLGTRLCVAHTCWLTREGINALEAHEDAIRPPPKPEPIAWWRRLADLNPWRTREATDV